MPASACRSVTTTGPSASISSRNEKQLPARPDGPGLRDRHQFQSLHRLPDGGKHDDDAGAGDRARLLTGTTPSSRATTCSAPGPTPKPSSTTWCSPSAISPSAKSATVSKQVENLLDSCHALMNYGVDRYKRPYPVSMREEQERPRNARLTCNRRSTTCGARRCRDVKMTRSTRHISASPRNRRKICSTSSRKTRPCWSPGSARSCASCARSAQYFYPQRQTQVMNEGWACFWHYHIAQRAVRRRPGHRRLHARVPAKPHQRDLPAAISTVSFTAASIPTRWVLR